MYLEMECAPWDKFLNHVQIIYLKQLETPQKTCQSKVSKTLLYRNMIVCK